MRKCVFIILLALILSSCTTQPSKSLFNTIASPLPPAIIPSQLPPVTRDEAVYNHLQNKPINWQTSLLPIVQKILEVDEINSGSILLVNTLKNSTNGNISTAKATEVLFNLISERKDKFQVVSANNLKMARQILGLSEHDTLELRSKAIGLARYLNAKYLLYGIAIVDVKKPILDFQLILVKTGEIIWSGTSIAKH